MSYRSMDRRRRGAGMSNLSHGASLQAGDNNAPSKSGTEHLDRWRVIGVENTICIRREHRLRHSPDSGWHISGARWYICETYWRRANRVEMLDRSRGADRKSLGIWSLRYLARVEPHVPACRRSARRLRRRASPLGDDTVRFRHTRGRATFEDVYPVAVICNCPWWFV